MTPIEPPLSLKSRLGPNLSLTIVKDNDVLSALHAVYTDDDRTMRICIITSLFTQEADRLKGYGTTLLRRLIYEARRNGVRRIEVDDCTDNFAQPERNIYVKQGFIYKDPGFPEMVLDL